MLDNILHKIDFKLNHVQFRSFIVFYLSIDIPFSIHYGLKTLELWNIEINAWSSFFITLKINLIFSLHPKSVKHSTNQSGVSEAGKF